LVAPIDLNVELYYQQFFMIKIRENLFPFFSLFKEPDSHGATGLWALSLIGRGLTRPHSESKDSSCLDIEGEISE